jgi:hypothetical protein
MEREIPATTKEATEATETIEVLEAGEARTGEVMACCKAGTSNTRV